MLCPGCQHENRPQVKFCEECGTPFKAAKTDAPRPASLEEIAAALNEARAQQTATAEILRVISRSATELQPVFDAIVDNATLLFRAWSAAIMQSDGQLVHLGALRGGWPGSEQSVRGLFPSPIHERPIAARCLADRTIVHIADIESDDPMVDQTTRDIGRSRGYRSALWVPMLRDGQPIGAISITRAEAGPFSSAEIELLKTFADQAVIAIENVRLFTELQEKNRALTQAHEHVTEALEQQTATAEILRVISSSPTDVQPVFDTIVRSASILCDAVQSNLQQFDGELLHLVATHNWPREGLDWARTLYPLRPDNSRGAGRAVHSRAVVHIPDVLEDPEYNLDSAREGGFRSVVSVPMLRDGQPIGVISVGKAAPGPFPDTQLSLLRTFADQAVIAIENV